MWLVGPPIMDHLSQPWKELNPKAINYEHGSEVNPVCLTSNTQSETERDDRLEEFDLRHNQVYWCRVLWVTLMHETNLNQF